MSTNLCNIYLWQSVGSLLKLEAAWAKKSELAWLGSATNLKSEPGSAQAQKHVWYPSWAWLGFGRKLDFRARLSLGLDINQVLSWASSGSHKNSWLAAPCIIYQGLRKWFWATTLILYMVWYLWLCILFCSKWPNYTSMVNNIEKISNSVRLFMIPKPHN